MWALVVDWRARRLVRDAETYPAPPLDDGSRAVPPCDARRGSRRLETARRGSRRLGDLMRSRENCSETHGILMNSVEIFLIMTEITVITCISHVFPVSLRKPPLPLYVRMYVCSMSGG